MPETRVSLHLQDGQGTGVSFSVHKSKLTGRVNTIIHMHKKDPYTGLVIELDEDSMVDVFRWWNEWRLQEAEGLLDV